MVSGNLEVQGGSLYYETEGDGIPIVFIHCGYLDSRMWDSQFRLFSEKFKVIRYDVRGFGKSSSPQGRYSDAADLRSLLENLKVDSAVIAVVSNGGRIALDFAVENPGSVRALILSDFGIMGYKSSGPDEDKLWEGLDSQEEDYLKFREAGRRREAAAIDVNMYSSALSGDEREKMLDIAESNVHTDKDDPDKHQVSPEPPAFDRLDSISMPVLIIEGEFDLPGFLAIGRRVHSLLPQSEFSVIEGADHVPALSRPDAFNGVVDDFLDKII